MNLEFESLEESLSPKSFDLGNDANDLQIALEDANATLKVALDDNKALQIMSVDKNEILEKVLEKNIDTAKVEEKLVAKNGSSKMVENLAKETESRLEQMMNKAEKLGFIGKLAVSLGRVGKTLVDSIAKKYLKDNFKINYSTYNSGKKAIMAALEKDGQTFFKKGFDAVIGLFKKVPATTKMVLRNVKNKVVEEVFSWSKFLIAK